MATQSQISAFLKSPVNDMWGLTEQNVIDYIVNTPRPTFRFWNWCGNDDPTQIKAVLDAVAAAGMSPAWFAAYEMNEGYTSGLGWCNHASYTGDVVGDASATAAAIVSSSQSAPGAATTWSLYGVSYSLPDPAAADAFYATLSQGSIGIGYMSETAAASASAVGQIISDPYHPQGYGDPLSGCVDILIEMNAKIDGTPTSVPATQANSKQGQQINSTNKQTPKKHPVQTTSTLTKAPLFTTNMGLSQYKNDIAITRYKNHFFAAAAKGNSPTQKVATAVSNAKASAPSTQAPKTNAGATPSGSVTTAQLDALKGLTGTSVGSTVPGQCIELVDAWVSLLKTGSETSGTCWSNLTAWSNGYWYGGATAYAVNWSSIGGFTVVPITDISQIIAGDIVPINGVASWGITTAVLPPGTPGGGQTSGHVAIAIGGGGLIQQNMATGPLANTGPVSAGETTTPVIQSPPNQGSLSDFASGIDHIIRYTG